MISPCSTPAPPQLPEDFWEQHPEVRSWTERGRTFYEVDRHEEDDWHPNQCLYLPGENAVELRVLHLDDSNATLVLLDDHSHANHHVWGIGARNREQNFALNALMDPDVDFVTLLGNAGTGKTLLALAAGLAQVMDQQRYREIIMTRATVSVGEDIGFLPGTEEEKMTPWMGALTDNLEVLANPEDGGSWGRQATNDLLASRIKIRSLNFMRGRTFLSPLPDHRRGAEPHPEADEDPDHPRRPGHQDRLPRQRRADRHALPHRDHLRPHLRGGPLQELGALGAHHAASWRTFATGGFRGRGFVSEARAGTGITRCVIPRSSIIQMTQPVAPHSRDATGISAAPGRIAPNE